MGTGVIRGIEVPPVRERPNRPAHERLLARAPWLLSVGLALFVRLPEGSRVRLRTAQQIVSRSFAAINRGDDWLVPISHEPDCEIHVAAGFRTIGFADCYRGPEGWRELIDAVREDLPDVRWKATRLIDLGDRWVMRAVMSGTGRASGAHTEQTWGSVIQLSSRGRIARQHIYWTWGEALAAAGLNESP
jgi:ketosteroid isomerase-like protein